MPVLSFRLRCSVFSLCVFDFRYMCNFLFVLPYAEGELNHDNSFSEFILLEIACKENTKLTLGVFYRSPSSTADNDLKLFDLINSLCTVGCIKKMKVVRLSCLGCRFVSLLDTLLL